MEELEKRDRLGQETRKEMEELARRMDEKAQKVQRIDREGAAIHRELDDMEESFSEERVERFRQAFKKIEAIAATHRTNRQ